MRVKHIKRLRGRNCWSGRYKNTGTKIIFKEKFGRTLNFYVLVRYFKNFLRVGRETFSNCVKGGLKWSGSKRWPTKV